jgi:hypothetical protein
MENQSKWFKETMKLQAYTMLLALVVDPAGVLRRP